MQIAHTAHYVKSIECTMSANSSFFQVSGHKFPTSGCHDAYLSASVTPAALGRSTICVIVLLANCVSIVVMNTSLSRPHDVMVAGLVITCVAMFYATVPPVFTAINTLMGISVGNLLRKWLNLAIFWSPLIPLSFWSRDVILSDLFSAK